LFEKQRESGPSVSSSDDGCGSFLGTSNHLCSNVLLSNTKHASPAHSSLKPFVKVFKKKNRMSTLLFVFGLLSCVVWGTQTCRNATTFLFCLFISPTTYGRWFLGHGGKAQPDHHVSSQHQCGNPNTDTPKPIPRSVSKRNQILAFRRDTQLTQRATYDKESRKPSKFCAACSSVELDSLKLHKNENQSRRSSKVKDDKGSDRCTYRQQPLGFFFGGASSGEKPEREPVPTEIESIVCCF
jgi:hypothetical protein